MSSSLWSTDQTDPNSFTLMMLWFQVFPLGQKRVQVIICLFTVCVCGSTRWRRSHQEVVASFSRRPSLFGSVS